MHTHTTHAFKLMQTHTCTSLIHTFMQRLTLTHTHTLAHSLTDTVSYTHSHTYTHKHSYPLAHMHTYTYTHSLKTWANCREVWWHLPSAALGSIPLVLPTGVTEAQMPVEAHWQSTRLRTGWMVQNSTGSVRRWPRCRESWVKPSPSSAWETTRGRLYPSSPAPIDRWETKHCQIQWGKKTSAISCEKSAAIRGSPDKRKIWHLVKSGKWPHPSNTKCKCRKSRCSPKRRL